MLLRLFVSVARLPFNTEGEEINWGTEVKPYSWPFMAVIDFYGISSYMKCCGSFLVAEDIIMTVAHSNGILGVTGQMNVNLGAHNIKKRESSQQTIPVVEAVPHQNYNKTKKINDIMLLKVHSADFCTIALPKRQSWVKPGQLCRVAGRGDWPMANHLTNFRKRTWKFRKSRRSTQLCVGNPKEKKASDKLHGDSRGPFLCSNVLQGIVSYVFTRMSSFLPWIQKMMKYLQHP
uniref:Peptidase S1 domain-containing protein n=1 Tax=Nannospalax galili TaxID=1026970 RepID=A0A8C6RPZ0_NANGA